VAERLKRLGGGVYVAEMDGAVVGFAALQVVPLLERERPLCRLTALVVDEEARRSGLGRALLERERPLCRLTALVVDEEARRPGLGRALLERVEDEARRLGCERLEVTSSARREDTRAFYGRLGFEEPPRRFLKTVS
jgi:GNAT superfamily N-acetyltransferase